MKKLLILLLTLSSLSAFAFDNNVNTSDEIESSMANGSPIILETAPYKSNGDECFVELSHNSTEIYIQVHDKDKSNEFRCEHDKKLIKLVRKNGKKNTYSGQGFTIKLLNSNSFISGKTLFLKNFLSECVTT